LPASAKRARAGEKAGLFFEGGSGVTRIISIELGFQQGERVQMSSLCADVPDGVCLRSALADLCFNAINEITRPNPQLPIKEGGE
jgi:hypothetical protein